MRLFLLGAPCAGKTTLMGPLRRELDCPVLDMDEELKVMNKGAWPPLERKRDLSRQVILQASELEDVVLAYSLLGDNELALLRAREWWLALLDLPESVMRSRAAIRERREGWSNVWWLPSHLDNIAYLRQRDAFTSVLDATRPVREVVEDVLALMRRCP